MKNLIIVILLVFLYLACDKLLVMTSEPSDYQRAIEASLRNKMIIQLEAMNKYHVNTIQELEEIECIKKLPPLELKEETRF